MHRVLLFVVGATSWWPSWNPTSVQLVAGQTATVQVQAKWSGLVDYGNGVHWAFRSDNDHVGTASLYLQDDAVHDVRIVAVGPGTAAIRYESNAGLSEQAYVVINVVCGAEPPVQPAAAVLHARLGRPSTVAVVSEIANR